MEQQTLTLPPCPRCGSINTHPIRPTLLARLLMLASRQQALSHCDRCGWRGRVRLAAAARRRRREGAPSIDARYRLDAGDVDLMRIDRALAPAPRDEQQPVREEW